MRDIYTNPEVAHRDRWITLGVLCVSLLVIVLDNTILNVGLIIFGIGSALSTIANDANVLIGTRALMGVGDAFIMPATLR